MFLQVMKQCGPPVPGVWRKTLARLLKSDNREIELATVDAIETLQFGGMEPDLEALPYTMDRLIKLSK